MNDPETEDSIDAAGILLTEIHCPKCDYVFSVDGNADRDVIECPNCNAQLCVTCK